MKHLFLIFALVFVLAPVAHAEKGALDGKTFHGKITNPEGTFDDDLIFSNSQFTSTACKSQGFNAAKYNGAVKGDMGSFTADLNHGKEVMHWQGKIMGDKVEATGTMTDEKGKTGPFSYTGTLASAGKMTKKK